MKNLTALAALFAALFAAELSAAVDGTVINQTTGKPQSGVLVTLVQPGQGGMQTIGTTKSDAEGKFKIDKPAAAEFPQILQSIYQGVIYTKVVPPGTPASGIEVPVFDASKDPAIATVSQHMILLEPGESSTSVNEAIIFHNESKSSFNDPAGGSMRFFLPEAAGGNVRVTINAAGGMPINRPAEKTKEAGVYKVDYPVKPGDTRLELAYTLSTDARKLVTRTLHKDGPTRVVVPPGVSVTGEGVKPLGAEPQTQAAIFEVPNGKINLAIEGSGSLQRPQTADGAAANPDDDPGIPGIQQIQPPVYQRFWWILGVSLGILALGFVLIFRSDTAEGKAAEALQGLAKEKGKRKS